MTLDFVIDHFERNLRNLQGRDVYADKLARMPQVTSLSEYNQMNLNILHMDEHDLLTKNIQFLKNTKQESLSKL